MRTFPIDEAIQLSGCRAIASLLEHPTHSASNLVALKRQQVVKIILNAMSLFVTNRDIQEVGIDVVQKFPLDPQEAKKACDTIIAAMGGFPFDRNLQHKSCVTLSAMMAKASTTTTTATTTMVLPAGVTLKDILPRDAVVIIGGLSAYIATRGACNLILLAMDNFPTDPVIQMVACHVLGHLTQQVSASVALGQAGGCEKVVSAIRSFPDVHELQVAAFLAVAGK